MPDFALLQDIQNTFEVHANAAVAEKMSAYMRHKSPFYGIKNPERKAISKSSLKALLESQADPVDVAIWCWDQPQREWHYTGMEYLSRAWKLWPKAGMTAHIESFVTRHSWWDSVDFLAVHVAGKFFLKYPLAKDSAIERWRSSENMWLVRTAILHQLQYKSGTDTELLASLCAEHAGSKEFFIQKAIGWALRQYAYTNPGFVIHFAKTQPLAALSRREALKHLA